MASTHRSALESKHEKLDRTITDELHRPMPDAIKLADLKKQKLKLKEEMLHSQ